MSLLKVSAALMVAMVATALPTEATRTLHPSALAGSTTEVEAPASVQFDPACAAACGANATKCVSGCHGLLKILCKAKCAIKATECMASCSKGTGKEAEAAAAKAVEEAKALAALEEAKAAAALEAQRMAAAEAAAPVDPVACIGVCSANAESCLHKCHGLLKVLCKLKCAKKLAECTKACSTEVSETEEISTIHAADAALFESFKSEHNKAYESPELEAHRFSLFQANMRRAEELSQLNPEAKFGMTQFSDLHPTEFKRQYLGFQPAVGDSAVLRQGVPTTKAGKVTAAALPTDFDWRKPDNGRPVGVTAVKDQGQCGSCWAFSATEAVESAYILSGKSAVALAPEQTVDCDTVDGGCNGGDTVSAYAYMQQYGVQTEQSYPYTAGDSGSAGTCAYKSSRVVAKPTGFTYATPGCSDACAKQDEEKLKESLYNVGPVSICVDAEPWQTYQSGILSNAAGCSSGYSDLDHCVQLVGYGVENGKAFWNVRNSWATSWGEAGYIRLAYGANTCGVADEATQVQI